MPSCLCPKPYYTDDKTHAVIKVIKTQGFVHYTDQHKGSHVLSLTPSAKAKEHLEQVLSYLSKVYIWTESVVAQWLEHLPLVLEVPGSIPAHGEENFGIRTRFL